MAERVSKRTERAAGTLPVNTFGSRFAIGGEFEIGLPNFADVSGMDRLTRGLQGSWAPSGRTALARILRTLQAQGVAHVHLPAYLCESVLSPVKACGMDWSFYPVDADLVAHPDPPKGSVVVLVHYFGRINPAAAALRREAGGDFFLIEDACQALLTDWRGPDDAGVYYLISPRKFGPALAGGWCNVAPSGEDDDDPRVAAVCYRSLAARQAKAAYHRTPSAAVDGPVEQFYLEAFSGMEAELDEFDSNTGIPGWAAQIIAGIDWESAADKRIKNHAILSRALMGDVEAPGGVYGAGDVPSGHFIRVNRRDELKERLAADRIFCPVHWRLPAEVDAQAFPEAHMLSRTTLTLPVDQRYTADHMTYLAERVKGAL